MAPRAIPVSEPVTLLLKDGTQVVTVVDETTKFHYVICDLCGEDISLTSSAHPYRIESHRTACKKKQQAALEKLSAKFTLFTRIFQSSSQIYRDKIPTISSSSSRPTQPLAVSGATQLLPSFNAPTPPGRLAFNRHKQHSHILRKYYSTAPTLHKNLETAPNASQKAQNHICKFSMEAWNHPNSSQKFGQAVVKRQPPWRGWGLEVRKLLFFELSNLANLWAEQLFAVSNGGINFGVANRLITYAKEDFGPFATKQVQTVACLKATDRLLKVPPAKGLEYTADLWLHYGVRQRSDFGDSNVNCGVGIDRPCDVDRTRLIYETVENRLASSWLSKPGEGFYTSRSKTAMAVGGGP
ncbi:hypothetical protein B0H13DRAFT_1851128 [Mycena leptocephala]|nr:hypothetical protein B0H13DRAFT_1851128 [Mycena leptocephala]